MLAQSKEHLLNEDDPLLTMDGVVEELNKQNLPTSRSWLEKLVVAREGPKVDCYWGRRPMWKRSTARAWALSRLKLEAT